MSEKVRVRLVLDLKGTTGKLVGDALNYIENGPVNTREAIIQAITVLYAADGVRLRNGSVDEIQHAKDVALRFIEARGLAPTEGSLATLHESVLRPATSESLLPSPASTESTAEEQLQEQISDLFA
jgi:hypothetical protein